MSLDISVIIVNYNVRYFIEQCIVSVFKAQGNLDIEIIVVDNNSVDNSVKAIKSKFPSVHLIANNENLGFAKANNQAIKIAKGKYILLLNPDTLIEEDTLEKSFEFMEATPEAGALGAKLIDGEGKFLPESKRSLPTLLTSLYRFVGLSKIFPKSKIFNKYNLGNLGEDDTNEVDVLCGAFMFIRSDIIPKVGYLDEDFFMYGEDIDYSYRIKNAGYKIYYFPKTTIVHFKGESTKKSSLKYHNIFYKAMAIFAKKHYGGKGVNPLLWLINIAVVGLAVANYIKGILKTVLLPLIDIILFFIVLILTQRAWGAFRFNNPDYYDLEKTFWMYLAFAFILVLGIKFNNGYKKNWIVNSIKGLGVGTLTILVIYALLPENIRFSRAIVIIGSFANMGILLISRFLTKSIFPSLFLQYENKKKTLIIGSKEEVDNVKRIMDIGGIDYEYIGALTPKSSSKQEFQEGFLGNISSLEEIIDSIKVDEVIFCLGDIEMSEVVNRMKEIGSKVHVKIAPNESQSIIGSSGRNSRGEFYNVEMGYKLSSISSKFFKYSFDFILAFTLLLFYPIGVLISKHTRIKDIFAILLNRKTWISYIQEDKEIDKLPNIKKGIFTPIFTSNVSSLSNEEIHNINIEYASRYSIWQDLEYLFKHLYNTRFKK